MSLKIMVLDHEQLTLRVIRSLAFSADHIVAGFESSSEAFQQLEKQRFDVVFIGMPRPDSTEICRLIQDSQLNNGAMIVAMVAGGDIATLRKAYEDGAILVLQKPLAAANVMAMMSAMGSPAWKSRKHVSRLPLFTDVRCKSENAYFSARSMNISESGMLLQASEDAAVEVEQQVSLEFSIAEVRASLDVRARIVRQEDDNRIGVEFMELAPEAQNAIKLYVIGRLSQNAPPKEAADLRGRRFWSQT